MSKALFCTRLVLSQMRCMDETGQLISVLMVAGMNGLDYALLIIVGLSILHGLARGALRMLTSILSLALGIYGAFIWHSRAAELAQSHLGTSATTSAIIGYVAIFLLVFTAVGFIGRRMIVLAHFVHLNLIDRLAGAAFGALLGVVIAGLNVALLTTFLRPDHPLLQNSELAPQVLEYDEELVGYVPPQVKQIYENNRDQLARYWKLKHNSPANTDESTR
jgi:membrane protein required for colicin V production